MTEPTPVKESRAEAPGYNPRLETDLVEAIRAIRAMPHFCNFTDREMAKFLANSMDRVADYLEAEVEAGDVWFFWGKYEPESFETALTMSETS